MKVSISKVATYAQPIHHEFLRIFSTHCADLGGAEQLIAILMIISIMRDTAIHIYGEETVKEIEDILNNIKEKEEGEVESEN